MPKFVVDLKNLDENIQKVERVFNIMKADLNNSGLVLSSHDLDGELESLKNFKTNLQNLYSREIGNKLSQQAECNTQLSNDDPNKFSLKNPVLKDEYGNIFYRDFEYDYVEIIYTNYELLEQVRLLGFSRPLLNQGESLVGFLTTVPVRYYFENLQNRLSGITPTTLKILENLEEFTGPDLGREILRVLRETIRKIDEACAKQLSSNNPDKWNLSTTKKDILGIKEQKEWRELSKKYFVPAAVIRSKNKDEEKLQDLQKELQKLEEDRENGIIKQESIDPINRRIEEVKQRVAEQLKKERIESQVNAKKEMPRAPVPTPNLDPCNTNPPKRTVKQNKSLENKLEAWKRRHSLACIIKDIKDCYIPPNLDFCQIVFKDPSINTFLTKLQALKAPGTSQIFDKITESVESKLGVKELREAAEKIKNLEILVADESELLSYFNSKIESFDYKLLNNLYPKLDGKNASISLYNERINSGELDDEQVANFNRKIQYAQQEKITLETEIRTLTVERSQISARLETLKVNKQINETELESLKSTYETRIQDLQFSQEQAELIRRGENLQAVFNAATQERLSGPQLFDSVVQAVDSIMPFENLCAMFFQNTLPNISFELPDVFQPGQLKNPFEGLYASWGRTITEFIIDVSLGFVDSLMASLCNSIDSAVANTTGIGSSGPNYQKFTNDLINNGYRAIEPLLRGDYSNIVEVGLDKFNTKIELGFKNPFTTNLEGQNEESSCVPTISINPPIQPIDVDISTNASGLLDFFFSNDRPNPLSEWNISSDRKSFTYQEPPSLFDFSQIDQFINNSVNEFVNPELGTGNFSLQALIESFVNKNSPPPSEAENPCETTGPLEEAEFATAASEVSCLMRNAASLLTPNQMLLMLQGTPPEEAKIIVSNLARICAPTITGRMGNDPSFLMNMMREAGTISGASDFLNSIKDLIDRNDFLPTTTSVSCERYDNTIQFIQGLMADTIPQELAKQILDKIEEKRIDNFNYILNTFASSNTGKEIARPQDALQFYLEIVDKLVEAKERGLEPQSLEQLGYKEPELAEDRDVKSILSQQDDFYKSQNPTSNTMLELVNESMLRPLRRTFKNDISSYVNVMAGLKEVVKEEELKEESQENDILSLDYLSSIFGESIPVLKIPTDVAVEIGNPSLTIAARQELEQIDSYKNNIVNELRQVEPGNFRNWPNKLKEKYENSSILSDQDKNKIANRNEGELLKLRNSWSNTALNISFEEIEELIKLGLKRDRYSNFNFPYEDVQLGEVIYTNLGSSIDVIDKRQSVYPKQGLYFGTNPNDPEDAGNFTNLNNGAQNQQGLPTQQELNGPPFQYHNPFGEDLCFLFNERNRTICHPYILEISMRAILASCKYVRRTMPNGEIVEKWVIPTNMNVAPGSPIISQNIAHLIEEISFISNRNTKSVNFYNSFNLFDIVYYNSIGGKQDPESPFYNPQIDNIIIDVNDYNGKFQKTKLIPLIPTNSNQEGRPLTEQQIFSFTYNILNKCNIIQNNINRYYNNVSLSLNNYFIEVKKIFESKIKDTFKVFGSIENIKLEKVPSWILPFEKAIGQNNIKTNRVLLQNVDNNNPTLFIDSNTFPPVIGDHYYISNGLVEDKYRTPFLTKENSPALITYITTSVNIVGEKFIENSINIPSNTTIEAKSENIYFSIKGQHGKSSGNPFLQNGTLFGSQNTNAAQQIPNQQVIQTQFCGDDIINDITSNAIQGIIPSSLSVIPSPTIKEKCFDEIIQDPTSVINIVDNLPDRTNLKNLLQDSLPKWELYYREQNNLMEIGLNTSGISFSPTGKKYDFYHSTVLQYDQNSIDPILSEKIINKFAELLNKNQSFYKFFDEKTERDLSLKVRNKEPETLPPTSFEINNRRNGLQLSNYIDIDMTTLYKNLLESNFYKFVDSFKNNRLLQDYKPENNSLINIKEEEKVSKKLLEMVPFTRDPTDFEKQNGLDPNIIDFENIKNEFKKLYSLESSDPLTEEQAIGRAASNSKTSKSAKNIFLLALIRLCVVEHIIKSIFLYDEIKFSKQSLNFSFVIKDIANFVLQEANRYGVGGLIHRQADKLYRTKVLEGKLEDSVADKQNFKKWNEEYSYDGKESSPRLQSLVKLELDKMLDKSSKILNCGSRAKDSSSIINSLLEDFNVYDAPRHHKVEGTQNIIPLSVNAIHYEKDFYLEKYIKLGRLNPNLENVFPGFKFSLNNTNIPNNYVENCIFSIKDFNNLISSFTEQQRNSLFLCENKESGIFIDAPKAGIRLILKVKQEKQDSLSQQSFMFNTSTLETEDVIKIKAYNIFLNKSEFFQAAEDNFGLPTLGDSTVVSTATGQQIQDERTDEDDGRRYFYSLNNLIISEQEEELNLQFLSVSQELSDSIFDSSYLRLLKQKLSLNTDTTIMFRYCLVLEETLQLLLVNSNLVHNDQNGRFLFESSKSYICDMTKRLKDFGDKRKIGNNLLNMLQQQKEREDNTGSPLGPAVEAMKFFYRTPIQILKGQATLVDPNIAIADKIVAAGAMAGALTGQKIDIPYKLASLALLPFPLFNGVAPPIPPLTTYNMAMPVGPVFLALEDLLKDLPYYQNQTPVDSNTTDASNSNPFFCELIPEENDD